MCFVADQHVNRAGLVGGERVEVVELLARSRADDLADAACECAGAGGVAHVDTIAGECGHEVEGDHRLAGARPAADQNRRGCAGCQGLAGLSHHAVERCELVIKEDVLGIALEHAADVFEELLARAGLAAQHAVEDIVARPSTDGLAERRGERVLIVMRKERALRPQIIELWREERIVLNEGVVVQVCTAVQDHGRRSLMEHRVPIGEVHDVRLGLGRGVGHVAMTTADPRDDLLTVGCFAFLPLLQLDDRGTVLPRIVRTSQHHVQALG